MSPIQRAHLLCSLAILVHDAQGSGDEYEFLTTIEIIVRRAGCASARHDAVGRW